MLDDLSRLGGPGTRGDAAVRDEVGHFIETCIRITPGARREVIDQRVLYQERRQYGSYSGGLTGKDAKAQSEFVVRGWKNNTKPWYVTPYTAPGTTRHGRRQAKLPEKERQHGRNSGQAWHQMDRQDRRWPDWIWNAYKAEEADRVADLATHMAEEAKIAQGARGLSAQSWLEIARALNLSIKVAGYIERAKPRDGKAYTNGTGREDRSGDGTFYVLENLQPLVVRHGGAEIADRAMGMRKTFFRRAVENGWHEDLVFLARHYPSLLAA